MMTLPFNIASRCPVLSVPSGFRVAAAHEQRYPWYTDPARRPPLG